MLTYIILYLFRGHVFTVNKKTVHLHWYTAAEKYKRPFNRPFNIYTLGMCLGKIIIYSVNYETKNIYIFSICIYLHKLKTRETGENNSKDAFSDIKYFKKKQVHVHFYGTGRHSWDIFIFTTCPLAHPALHSAVGLSPR